MKYGTNLLLSVATLLMVGPVMAQQTDAERQQIEAERQRIESERFGQQRLEQAEAEKRMREAEQRLAEAARQIAELSSRQLPRVAKIERQIQIDGRPRLGVTIGSSDDDGDSGRTEGINILGVSPGGAADEAGLRAGDTITSINGESFAADSAGEANRKLLKFMSGVKEGDVLKVDYLRKGKAGAVELAPKAMSGRVYAFGGTDFDFTMPVPPEAPGAPRHGAERWMWISGGGGFGDMELVTLTERLGKYFGTDKGLLVVRAPDSENFKLEDGDVIQRIDGREPTSVSHAMRILGSYQAGEKFDIEIMRDKKRQKISIEMPDNRQSSLKEFHVPEAGAVLAVAPAVTAPPAPAKRPRQPGERT